MVSVTVDAPDLVAVGSAGSAAISTILTVGFDSTCSSIAFILFSKSPICCREYSNIYPYSSALRSFLVRSLGDASRGIIQPRHPTDSV